MSATTDVPVQGHPWWVRVAHWIVTASFLTLVITGVGILMVHPRLYWGEAGNDLTPALVELPISRNHQHGGWVNRAAFFPDAAGPVSASRTYEIFNENGWGRSLHFLGAWLFVVPGAFYLLAGIVSGHFRRHFVPGAKELAPRHVGRELVEHLRFRVARSRSGPPYGLLQKCAYCAVVFLALPLAVVTGLAMSPAITAAVPFLSSMFGGHQSARTIHFSAFVVMILFLVAHVLMVVASGFRRQMRAMTLGTPPSTVPEADGGEA